MSDVLDDLKDCDAAMPKFNPLPQKVAPGAKPVVYPAEVQSVMDTFSIQEQQDVWLGEQICVLNHNLGCLIVAFQNDREERKGSREADRMDRQSMAERITRLEKKPARVLGVLLKHPLTVIILTLVAAWIAGKLGIKLP